MRSLALLGLLALPGKAQVAPQAALQEVAGRILEVPALPSSLQDARARFPAVKAAILADLREMEADLLACYPKPGAKDGFNVMSRTLVVGGGHEAQALAAADFIKDYAYLALETRVREHWNGWQSALLTRAWFLDGTSGGRSIQLESRMFPLNYADYETHARADRIRIYGEGAPPVLLEELARAGRQFSGLTAIRFLDYRHDSKEVQQAAAFSEGQLRGLTEVWNPLRTYLAGNALAFLRFEYDAKGLPDPGLQALLLKAKAQILERCRYNLWFCLLAWAHLASEPLPELYARFPGVY